MQIFGIQILAALLSYGNGDLLRSLECEHCSLKTAFDTNVHVEAGVSYPKLLETSMLAKYANESIRNEALDLYDAFVGEMSPPQEELWEEEEDERIFYYGLDPVYCSGDLTSLYGHIYQYRGGVHGSSRYITKTFWQHDSKVLELSLDDLFLAGGREWLFKQCENYFKSNRCGYYADEDSAWVGFSPEHLDTFVLTEKGLLLIFQNYVVSGYEDEPITLYISYDELAAIAKPDGPLFDLAMSKVISMDE